MGLLLMVDAWSMHDFLDRHLPTLFDGAVSETLLQPKRWGMSSLLNDLLHWPVHNHRHFPCDFLLLPYSWCGHHFLGRYWY